jgi:3-deoxy-7-phosphoheptulonate synthase
MPGAERTAVGVTGNHGPVPAEEFESLAGVAEAIPVSKPYKLVSREVKPDNTVVDVAGVLVGGSELAMCAGPCSVESREQILEAARAVKAAALNSCAVERTSRGPRPMRFKAWAKKVFDT